MPENLSYQPFSPVPLYGVTKLFRCGDAEASLLPLVWQNEDGAETAIETEALFVHQLKIRPSSNPFVRTESGRSRHSHGYSLLTVKRLRPFARRRLRTRRPFLVLIRTRNPCVPARRRLFG